MVHTLRQGSRSPFEPSGGSEGVDNESADGQTELVLMACDQVLDLVVHWFASLPFGEPWEGSCERQRKNDGHSRCASHFE